MIFDWDDIAGETWFLARMYDLKHLRDDFKATLFCIPGQGDAAIWWDYPEWLELVPHGWLHPHPHEAEEWSRERTLEVLDDPVVTEFMVCGWKSPGWNVSNGTYDALLERGHWLADHPKNNARRPVGLRCHLLGSPDHFHGHVGSVGVDNGIRETWGKVKDLVREAESFEFMSEAVKPWKTTAKVA